MKTARLLLCLFLIPQLVFGPCLQAETLPYSLVDRDRYDIFEDERKAKAEEELIIKDTPDDAQLLKYTNEFWRQAVTAVEGDYSLDKEPEPIPDLTLLNPTLSLPIYGTNIALTGRYVVGFKMDAKRYSEDANNDIEERNVRNFEMQQEMQIKMQGKILDRIFVDIDYDDKREDEKTLSVAYRGKTGEFVQSAEFGDINLSLPQTEFIAYQKQLFGAKVHLQHKDLDLRIIGSQTKGSSKQKQFIGSSVFEIVSIADVDYIRRTYYDLTFGSNVGLDSGWSVDMGNIAPGTEEVYLYTNSTDGDYVPISLTARDYKDSSVSYPAKFKLLQRGVDYTVDYSRGIIRFASAQSAASVIAVNYQNAAGKWLSPNQNEPYLIKTENEKPIFSNDEIGYQLEMKTFYSIGAQQITRDNGKGNFILTLLDANGQEIGSKASPKQVYPATIDMDFDRGVFELQSRMLDDRGLYNATPVSSKNRTFKVEYTSTVKTYFVEADMVVESESVKLNGRQLQRNNDYYIDYTSGFITFYKGDQITENSVIDITYDTTNGSDSNNSLIGGRLDYKLFDKIKLGSTVLKEGWDKPQSVPQVGNYAKDLLIYGADINAKDLQVTDKVAVDFGAEVAKSEKNENVYGYAMIDSMNDANIQVGGSRVFYDWTIASNPNAKPAFLDSVSWDTQELPMLEINPNAIGTYNEKQQVLVINYDFTKPQTVNMGSFSEHDEISIVYPLSDSGVDLSDKTSFELTMLGEGSAIAAPELNVTFGNISEYSDSINPLNVPGGLAAGEYGMYTACSGGDSAPKTEDVNCLETLAPNEDRGWWFANPDGTVQRFDPFTKNLYNPERQPNGRIDSQDLNHNGKYDSEDNNVGGSFGYAGVDINGMTNNSLSFDGWKTFSTPLTVDDKNRWNAVRHLRVTLKLTDEMKAAGKLKGTVKIANVALAGTAWNPQEDTDPNKFAVSGINNVDNTNYVPIFSPNTGDGLQVFNELYGSVANYKAQSDSANIMDQALNITYKDIISNEGDSFFANRNFKTMDFTQHKEFRFLLHNNNQNPDAEFFLKVGTDENYDKIIVPLGEGKDQWRLISLKMVDTNGDGITDTFENISPADYGVEVRNVRQNGGMMNFKKVSMIMAGISATSTVDPATGEENYASNSGSGSVWINVIHLADAITTKGTAYKVDGAVRMDGWGSAGAKYKYMDGDFETPLTVSKDQEITEEEYFLKVDRVKHFPLEATFNRSTTVTPNIADTTDYNTISTLDKGSVERQRAVVRGDFIKDNLPKVGLQYTMDQVDYDLMKRKDKAQTYAVTMSHEGKGSFKNINAGYSFTDTQIHYAQEVHSDTNYNTQEQTQRLNMKLKYEPHKNFNLTPSYSLTQSKEERTQHSALNPTYHRRYPKAMNQNAGFNSTWRITKWLAPSLSYSIATTETNNLTEKIFNKNTADEKTFEAGELKSLNRNADGGISLTLNGNEIMPKSKLFKSFVISSSYRLQDADSWNYIDDDFDAKRELWIRSSLSGTGKYASRQSLILRDTITSSQRWMPLSAYDLGGQLAPLKTVSFLNNFTHSTQQNNQTGTVYESKSMTLPDAVLSISDLEKFFYGGRWVNSTNLKLRFSEVQSLTVGSDEKMEKKYGADLRFLLFNFFDTVLMYDKQDSWKDDLKAGESLEQIHGENFSAQTSFYVGNWRFTPKILYSEYEKQLVRGQISQSSSEFTPSLNVRLDFNLPRGIKMPFVNRMYNATNRVIWNTTLSYTQKESPVEVKDNYDKLDILSSLDYELSQNLRLNVAAGVTWLNHAYVATEDYMAYNLAANVTIQF